jgi:uncharacterized protein (TIGR02246 family)
MLSEVNEIEDERLIHDIVLAVHETWNQWDQPARASLFAGDADFTNVRGNTFRGRGEILAFHQSELMVGMFMGSHSKPTSVEIKFIKPDVAAVDCRWEMTGSRYPDGREWPFRQGIIVMLMVKEKGEWVIKVFHAMELPLAT